MNARSPPRRSGGKWFRPLERVRRHGWCRESEGRFCSERRTRMRRFVQVVLVASLAFLGSTPSWAHYSSAAAASGVAAASGGGGGAVAVGSGVAAASGGGGAVAGGRGAAAASGGGVCGIGGGSAVMTGVGVASGSGGA